MSGTVSRTVTRKIPRANRAPLALTNIPPAFQAGDRTGRVVPGAAKGARMARKNGNRANAFKRKPVGLIYGGGISVTARRNKNVETTAPNA